MKAQVHASNGKLEAAISDQTMAIKRIPSRAEYYYQRAELHRRLHDIPKAIQDLDEAVN